MIFFTFPQMIFPLFLLFLDPFHDHPKLRLSTFGPGLGLANDVSTESTPIKNTTADTLSTEDEELFRQWTSKSLPLTADNRPISVNVMLYLESLRDVSSDVTLDFYMIEGWRDLRYVGMPQQTHKWRSPYNTVKIPGTASEKFWYPDSYFYLVKAVNFDRNAQFMEIFNNGDITFNRKVRIVIPCKPNVRMFPFDVTTCRLMMSSYAYTTKELTYMWNLQGIWKDEDAHDYIEEAGFELRSIPVNNLTLNYSTGQIFSAITGDFKLKRKNLVYIVQTFVPSALITALSWITFWISRTATPARASIGITTVLTMLTLGSGSSSRYDKHINGAISAIDIYVWVCFSFVILSLLEFAVADYWNQTEVNKSKNTPSQNNNSSSSSLWPRKAAVRGQTTNRHFRYYHSTAAADADGIVHHNCSNCGPPRGHEMSNLLTNNNDMPHLPTNNGHKAGEDFVCELPPVGENSQTNGPSQTRWFMDLNRHRTCNNSSDPRKVAPTIDLVARWIFPTSFLIFNIVYWYIILWHLDANF